MVSSASAQSCARGSPSVPGPNSTASSSSPTSRSPHVDHELVHADPTADPELPAVDRDGCRVGRVTRHPVAVPQRHQGERGLAVGRVGVAVGDALAGPDALHVRQGRAQGHRRHQPVVALDRGEAVDRDARAHQVEVGLGQGQGRRRVAEVAPAHRQSGGLRMRECLPVARELALDRRVPGLVGAGEVAPHAGRLDAVGRAGLAHEVGPDGVVRAVAREPGVGLELHVRRGPGLAGGGADQAQLPDAVDRDVDRGGDGVAEPVVLGHGPEPGEHRGVDPGGAQRERLLERRRAQPGGAAGQGGASRREDAVAVAVGLDHRHHLGGGAGPERRHVVTDPVQVDPGLRSQHAVSLSEVRSASPQLARRRICGITMRRGAARDTRALSRSAIARASARSTHQHTTCRSLTATTTAYRRAPRTHVDVA